MPLFDFILPENTVQGVTGGSVLAGISNADNGTQIELGVTLPWFKNPKASWLGYRCWIEVYLDPGIAMHKPLPQSPQSIDTLASAAADPLAKKNVQIGNNLAAAPFGPLPIDQTALGVNLTSAGKFTDYHQRMATSTYTFVLRGWGIRAGYQVPVPGMVSVAGIACVPGRQWSLGNRLEGNYSGVPVFFNAWELWYSISVPPTGPQVPPPNLSEHIRADVQLPDGMQVPYSQPDQNSVAAIPGGRQVQPQQFQQGK